MIMLKILVFVGVFLVILPLAEYLYERRPARRARITNAMLTSAELQVDEETLSRLDRYTKRRVRWGILGNEAGAILSVPLALAMIHAKVGLPAFIVFAMMGGMGRALGNAASGLTTADVGQDHPRMATLQPHQATDYLSYGEIAAEVACGCVGVVAMVVSAAALVMRAQDGRFWLSGTLAGVGVTALTVTAVALQRRLLRAPVRASTTSQIVAQDLVLAQGLSDLARAVLGTTALCVYGSLVWSDNTFVFALLFLGFYVLADRWLFGVDRPRRRLPVARQLAGVGHA